MNIRYKIIPNLKSTELIISLTIRKHRYWGWYSDTELLGAISDKVSAGFRFRIKQYHDR